MPVRVVVVDGSQTLVGMLDGWQGAVVVGNSGNAATSVAMIDGAAPDVALVDVELPGSAEVLACLNARRVPFIAVSGSPVGARTSIEAMRLGAVGGYVRPTSDELAASSRPHESLASLIAEAAAAKLVSRGPGNRVLVDLRVKDAVVAIAGGLGSVEAIFKLVGALPANCAPTFVLVDLAPRLVQALCARLAEIGAARVVEASDGMEVTPGRVYVVPGGLHHMEVAAAVPPSVRIRQGLSVSGKSPSADVLFRSIARAFGRRSVAVLLSGFGADGVDGCAAIKRAGGMAIAQDEASAAAFGMARHANAVGVVDRMLPLGGIGSALASLTSP